MMAATAQYSKLQYVCCIIQSVLICNMMRKGYYQRPNKKWERMAKERMVDDVEKDLKHKDTSIITMSTRN